MIKIDEAKFGELLVAGGLLTTETLREINTVAQSSGMRIYDILTERRAFDDAVMGQLVATHYKVPFIDLRQLTIQDNLLHVVPERVAKKKRCLVFERTDNKIKFATEDPEDTQTQELIRVKTGGELEVYYTTPLSINRALNTFKTDIKKAFQDLSDEAEKKGDTGESGESAPISELVDVLFENAYKENASDIHLEPQDSQAIIRHRIDGILHDVITIQKSIHERIMSRLKVLALLRTDEHLAAQDGKIRAQISGQPVDIRLSILPVVDGEKAVMRVLSTHGKPLTLEDLGMSTKDFERVKSAFSRPFGMVLTTGPTGSGKSTSIYAILRILNTRDVNITTIEDPVEYRIKGVNQINVNAKTGLTFASGLRSILRQDPNIVSVGEIRDGETANIAVNAALTGHLVLSTLHTNNASTSMLRLVDMKVEPFLVASTVNIIIAQRLVRRICKDCRVAMQTPPEHLSGLFGEEWVKKYVQDAPEIQTYKGQGCKTCGQTGYVGRLGLFETLVMSPKIRELTIQKESADLVDKVAIEEGMTPMSIDGLEKILQGLTTIEEVGRVTKTE